MISFLDFLFLFAFSVVFLATNFEKKDFSSIILSVISIYLLYCRQFTELLPLLVLFKIIPCELLPAYMFKHKCFVFASSAELISLASIFSCKNIKLFPLDTGEFLRWESVLLLSSGSVTSVSTEF